MKTKVLAIILASSSIGLAADYAVTAKVGTLGAGLDLTTGLTDSLNLRLNGNYFTYSREDTIEDVSYDADLNFKSFGLLADWHCFNNGFRITGGVYYNGNKIDSTGIPTAGEYEINGTNYTAADIGTLKTDVELGNQVAPYLGFGWGNAIDKEGHWSFSLDVGVLFVGSPDVSASVTGPAAANTAFQNDLEAEVKNIEDDIDFPIYPVVSVGLSYKF